MKKIIAIGVILSLMTFSACSDSENDNKPAVTTTVVTEATTESIDYSEMKYCATPEECIENALTALITHNEEMYKGVTNVQSRYVYGEAHKQYLEVLRDAGIEDYREERSIDDFTITVEENRKDSFTGKATLNGTNVYVGIAINYDIEEDGYYVRSVYTSEPKTLDE